MFLKTYLKCVLCDAVGSVLLLTRVQIPHASGYARPFLAQRG